MTLLTVTTNWDWSAILAITLVSFGLVLFILFLLVFVMKIFGLFFKEKNTSKVVETASATKEVEKQSGSEEEVAAAISVAIALAQGALHVEEAGFLTFNSSRETSWNNKAYGISRMPEHIYNK